ncbi:MAG: hypothetical protein R2788_07745 [Saprospiraceae bacterium]
MFYPMGQRKFLGLAAWQWLGAGILLLLAWLLQVLVSRVVAPTGAAVGEVKNSCAV